MESDLDFDMPLWIAGPAVLLCLLLAAYLSAAETAITGASRPRMHRLAQQGNKRAAVVNSLLDRKDEAVSAVLLGNSVVNILSASLTTAVLTQIFGAAGIVYATAIIGVVVVGYAQARCAPAPPPRGADPRAFDRRHAGSAGAAGGRRRLGLAHLPARD